MIPQYEFEKLAARYEKETGHMSFAHMYRRTPSYQQLMAMGDEVIPLIIRGFVAHDQNERSNLGLQFDLWGMCWVTILMDLMHHSPIHPEPVADSGFVKWNVNDTCRAWITWYEEKERWIKGETQRPQTT